MITLCIENLNDINELLNKINDDQYSRKSSILSGASIGQHIRHIVEFYICLLQGIDHGTINYDSRKRNYLTECRTKVAQEKIEEIIHDLSFIDKDHYVILEGNYTAIEQETNKIKTTLLRELAYNLEHSIHHQALIKVGLKEQGLEHMINENFGIAPATLRYKKQLIN
jgi:uncharacterized damage-inducible protein DinB